MQFQSPLSLVPRVSASLVLASCLFAQAEPAKAIPGQEAATLPRPAKSANSRADKTASYKVDRLEIDGQPFVRRETRANAFTQSSQWKASLATTRGAALSLTWESRKQRGGYSATYRQDFDAAGRRKGSELPLAVQRERHQYHPSLALGKSSWAAWDTFDLTKRGAESWIRRLDAAEAQRVGSRQSHGVLVRELPGGAALVVWTEELSKNVTRIAFGRFGKDGKLLSKTRGLQSFASAERGDLATAAVAEDGSFAIAWAAQDADGNPDGLRLRLFDKNAKSASETVSIVGESPLGSIEPSLARVPHQGYVIAWHDNAGSRDHYDVLAQRIDEQGKLLGKPMLVAKAESHQSGAQVAAARDGSGRIVFAWNQSEKDGRHHDIMARIFHFDGKPRGKAFRLTAAERGNQELTVASNRRSLACLDSGGIALAWSGDAGLGDKSGVHLTLALPEASPLAKAVLLPEDSALHAFEDESKPQEGHAIVSGPHDPPVFTGFVAQDRSDPNPGPLADAGFIGITNTGWTPPDTRAAVGPNHVVCIVNGGIAFFTKAGKRTFFQTISGSRGFWGSKGATSFVFDPRVVFDPHSGRFIAIAAEHDRSASPRQGYFNIAVSDNDDPNGTWYKYRYNVTTAARGYFVDYPHVGVDDKAIYVTSNNFSGGFSHMVFIVDKKPMLKGSAAPTPKILRPSRVVTASAAMGVQYGSSPGGILVNTSGSTSIRVHVVRNPLTNPSLVSATLAVPYYTNPSSAPQLGSTARISAVDRRIMQLTYRNGRVWVSHGIRNRSGQTVARWYEIDLQNWPTSGSPRIVQQGEVNAGSGISTFLPSINADIYGNIVLCCARSSSSERCSIFRAYRKPTDTLGTMPNTAIVRTSASAYTRGRWGDYSSVMLDPRDQATLWYAHEYATSTSRWNTWIGRVRVQGPTFSANKTSFSASAGGSVDFTLDNAPYANQGYVILGSVTGTTPGFRLPDAPQVVNMDLNQDGFTSIVVGSLNSTLFQRFAGSFDKTGKATARFQLPSIPALAGLNFYFAYAANDGKAWNFASETLNVRLTK